MFQLLEPIATVAYFAPELQNVCERLGLTAHRMSYYAPRAAALGPVAAEVVAACFFHHPMALVRPAIPRAWQIAAPPTILAARLEAVDAALRRLWGARITSAAMVEAAGLAREAAAACDLGGRVLYAAHAALPWPQPAHLLLWHALNLLREHRGDGHIISLVSARLDSCEATATLIASAGEDQAGRRGRWSDEAWNAAVGRLQARGWLDPTAPRPPRVVPAATRWSAAPISSPCVPGSSSVVSARTACGRCSRNSSTSSRHSTGCRSARR
jgi:hypothetical protein